MNEKLLFNNTKFKFNNNYIIALRVHCYVQIGYPQVINKDGIYS